MKKSKYIREYDRMNTYRTLSFVYIGILVLIMLSEGIWGMFKTIGTIGNILLMVAIAGAVQNPSYLLKKEEFLKALEKADFEEIEKSYKNSLTFQNGHKYTGWEKQLLKEKIEQIKNK